MVADTAESGYLLSSLHARRHERTWQADRHEDTATCHPPFTVDDVDNLFNLNSDPEVMRYLGRSASREVLRDEIIPFHLGVYQRFDRLGTWAAESVSTGEFLGWFHFRAEDGDITNIDLGYRLRREAWNKGYGTEGSAALINMGFTGLGVQRVFAHVMVANAASRRVLEKCGLTLVRTVPHRGPDADVIDGAGQGEAEYALTNRMGSPHRQPNAMKA
jgi:RimJ/RimL family protein N-acetyltransferase